MGTEGGGVEGQRGGRGLVGEEETERKMGKKSQTHPHKPALTLTIVSWRQHARPKGPKRTERQDRSIRTGTQKHPAFSETPAGRRAEAGGAGC